MNERFFISRLFSMIAIALALALAPTGIAYADSGNQPQPDQPTPEPVIITQGGPVVHREVVERIDGAGDVSRLAPLNRIGSTNAYWKWLYPLDITHYGWHNSQSDLVEDSIKVDGNLTVGGILCDSCQHHTSGQNAFCETSELMHVYYSITAKSWHSFQKTGYVDQNFTSTKTVDP